MNLPGHLAVSYLIGRRSDARRVATWLMVLAGTVTPDVIDKSALAIGLTPYGRAVGHSVFLWGWAALGAMWARGRGWRRARPLTLVTIGGVSHLVADLINDVAEGLQHSGYVFSGWFGWPWTNPDMMAVRSPSLFGPAPGAPTALELATVFLCALALFHDRR